MATADRRGPGWVAGGSSGATAEQEPRDRPDREHADGDPGDQRRPLGPCREDVTPTLGRLLLFERWRHLRAVDARDAGEAELPVQALQPVDAVLGERDARSGHDLPDRRGDEHLAGSTHRHHAGRRVHHESAGLATGRLELAEAHAGTDLDPELAHGLGGRDRAADRVCRALERGEEPVARRVDLPPAEPAELSPDDAVMPGGELDPARVAHLGGDRRGAHDVREQHGAHRAPRRPSLHRRSVCRGRRDLGARPSAGERGLMPAGARGSGPRRRRCPSARTARAPPRTRRARRRRGPPPPGRSPSPRAHRLASRRSRSPR